MSKHRSDVFRLATLLPVGEQLVLTPKIVADLSAFLAAFPSESPERPAIRQSLHNSGIRMTLPDLLGIIKTHFRVRD